MTLFFLANWMIRPTVFVVYSSDLLLSMLLCNLYYDYKGTYYIHILLLLPMHLSLHFFLLISYVFFSLLLRYVPANHLKH